MIKQYSNYKVNGYNINGKRTLGILNLEPDTFFLEVRHGAVVPQETQTCRGKAAPSITCTRVNDHLDTLVTLSSFN